MPMYSAVINIDLKYVFEADNRKEAILKVQDIVLPKHYLIDSFKIKSIKTADDNPKSFYHLEEVK